MAVTPKVLLKRSSVAGRVPSTSDLDYGELAINFADGKIYYKNSSNQIQAFVDSARVEEIANAVEVIARAQLDSGEVTNLIDSSYVQSLIPESYLATLIDSAYVNLRADHYTSANHDSDFEIKYATKSTTDLPEGINLYYTKARADSDIAASLNDSGNTVSITINNTIEDKVDSAYVLARVQEAPFLDSADAIQLIDSAYIQARQVDLQRDSGFITNIIDSAYIQARENNPAVLDSVDVLSLIDSDYIKTVTGIDADTLDGQHGNYYRDWNNVTNAPTILDLTDVSTQITADVDKAFVDALNVDADTLDGQQGTYYLDYNNFTNTPAIQDSVDVVGIVDSTYVQARQDFAYGSLTGVPTTVSTFTNDANYLDSTTVQPLLPKFGTDYVDSQTVLDIITREGLDSDLVISLVDSAYIALRDRFQDSSLVTSTVDATYVQARVPESYLETIIDSAYIETRRPAETIFNVVNSGASAYTFTGDGFSSGANNPTLYLQRGKTYKFNINASSHPFQIRVSNGGAAYSTGVTNNGQNNGVLLFTPDMSAPNTLVYQCTIHGGMVGDIVIIDNNSFLDSSSVASVITQAYVTSLNVDADLLDGQTGSFYLDYNNFSNTPTVPTLGNDFIDSNQATLIVDSAYVQARQSGGEITIQDEGSALSTAATTLNFVGSAVVASGTGTTKTITISQAEGGTDSATVSAIILSDVDSAYVQARQTSGGGGSGIDSAATIQLIDSNYVQSRQLTVTAADLTQTTNNFTADSGQISFTGLDIDSNKFQVYLNGLLLPRSDFTHNSSKVDLLVAADSGDILEVIKFGGNQVNGLDSALITQLIDSAYVAARTSASGGSIDSGDVIQLIDSAYVAARTSAGTDSATVSSIITADVDSDFIFDITKIKAKKKYYIQPNQPTISEIGEYWYKTDSDILYKAVSNTTLTTTMPGYAISTTVHYNKIYDWAGNNPSSATRTNISGTDALGGSFTSGTTASAWFFFTTSLSPPALNASADYDFTTPQDLRGIIIEDGNHNAGRLERIDYENGDYADNGFPGGGTVTWYASGGAALGKTANANTTGNTFVDISHPSGVKATGIGFSQIGDYNSGNDVFLFFAGNPIWQEIDRARTNSDLGLDSNAVTSLIDSAYVQARQTSGGGGTVDSAYVQSVVDSAAIPFTQEFYHFTADSGQLTFSGFDDDSETLSYTDGALAVYLNGILLVDSIDYTATNGTSVILQDSAEQGDVLTVLKFGGNTTGIDSADVINLIDSAYIAARTSSSGIANIVEDTTPQLGGALDGNGNDIFLDDDDLFAWGGSPGRTNIQGKASTSYSSNYVKVNVRSGASQSSTIAKFTQDDGVYTTIGLNLPNWNTALNDYYDLKIKGPTSNTLVANETIRFPDSSGTVALTKDVLDSSAVIRLITANAIDSGVALELLLDSIETINLIDSDYVKLRVTKSDLDMEGNKVLFANVYDSVGALPNATTYHGMFAHVHATGAGYFAHAGNWTRLANQSEIFDGAYSSLTGTPALIDSALTTQLIDSAYIQARQTSGGGGGGSLTIQDEGSSLTTAATTLNFVGSGVTASGTGSTKTITITGGGGGGSGGLDSALVSQLIDSDYIGTKVDFTRGEFSTQRSQYTATAAQTVFNHSSIDASHLDVYLNGILQVVNDDYTASTSAVTFTTGVDSGYSVSIIERRGRVITHRGLVEAKYYFTTPTPTTSITGSDDNGVTLDYSTGGLDVFLNGILLKDSDDYSTNAGTTVTLVSATDSNDIVTLVNRKGVVVSPNVKNYEYTATAGQLTFTGEDINGNTLGYANGAIQVHLNGILLRNADYTATNGTSIILNDSATLNDELVVSAFSNPGQNMDLYKFVADSDQTQFSGNDITGASLAYQPGNVQVFLNGLLMNDSDDYTATNGMSVVFNNAVNSLDEIKIASFVNNKDNLRTNAWLAPTGTVSASSGDKLFIDTSGGARTITLPSSASLGDEIRVIDVTGNASTNNITINRNGHKIQGATANLTINVDRAGIGLVYYNATQGWVLIEN